MSGEWYADLVSSGCYKGAIDLTPGDGGLCYACIMKGIPCLCVAWNDMHAQHLKQHMVARVLTAMTVPSSPAWLFEPGLVEVVSGLPSQPTVPAGAEAEARGAEAAAEAAAEPRSLPRANSAPGASPAGATSAGDSPGGGMAALEKLKQMFAQRVAGH